MDIECSAVHRAHNHNGGRAAGGRSGWSAKATVTATLPKTLAASNLAKQTVADYLQTMLHTHVVVQVGKPGLKRNSPATQHVERFCCASTSFVMMFLRGRKRVHMEKRLANVVERRTFQVR